MNILFDSGYEVFRWILFERSTTSIAAHEPSNSVVVNVVTCFTIGFNNFFSDRAVESFFAGSFCKPVWTREEF